MGRHVIQLASQLHDQLLTPYAIAIATTTRWSLDGRDNPSGPFSLETLRVRRSPSSLAGKG